jgi:hypothetical protein
MEAAPGVGQLGFVDHQAGVGRAILHHVEDLVKRHFDEDEIGLKDAQVKNAVVMRPGMAIRLPFSSSGVIG